MWLRFSNELIHDVFSTQEKANVAKIFASIHQSVVTMSKRMLFELKRHTYVTPTNYLELVSGYKRFVIFSFRFIDTDIIIHITRAQDLHKILCDQVLVGCVRVVKAIYSYHPRRKDILTDTIPILCALCSYALIFFSFQNS